MIDSKQFNGQRNALIRILAVSLCITIPTRAADYFYSLNLNSAQASTSPTSVSWLLIGAPAFNLQAGDNLTGTIIFEDNQRLRFDDPDGTANEGISVRFTSPVPAVFNSSNITILLDVQGDLSNPNPYYGGIGSGGSYVSNLAYEYGTITGSQLSFSGFEYSIHIISGGGEFTPQQVSFSSSGGSGRVSLIPEPSSVFLLGGFGFIALSRRRRDCSPHTRSR